MTIFQKIFEHFFYNPKNGTNDGTIGLSFRE